MLRQIGRYELLEEIGHGGMATVFRGRDSRLDRPVAVKVMHPHLRKTPEARARFTREAQSVARLRHPNILEIYDNSDEDSEDAFIVTELLTGPTLKTFREGLAEMPAEVAAAAVIEVAKALHAAHEAGVIHRDVKPENVLLHRDACLKLTDFGIAQMVDAQSFTATGQILGSPGHMAPEQIEGGTCDARADVFALGTVLYYLSTGCLPFEGQNAHQVLRRVVEGDFADPLRVMPTIGAGLADVVHKSLEKDPEARFDDAGALAEALSAWLTLQGIEDSAALLAEFLKTPAEVGKRVRKASLKRALLLATQAISERDSWRAARHLNRALSLDEGNAEALAAMKRLHSGARTRSVLSLAGALLGVVGVGAIGFAAFGDFSPSPTAGGRLAGEGTARSGQRAPTKRGDLMVQSSDAGAETDSDVPGQDPEARIVEGTPPQTATGRVAQIARPQENPEEGSTRKVCFAPSPRNVTLAVNGGSPAPFTPTTRCRSLEVGTHQVVAQGAAGCCDPLTRSFRVTAGEGEQRVPLELTFKASRLYVNLSAEGEVPPNGDVRLNNGVSGGTRQFLEVPMESFRRRERYRVEVPGYASYNGVVELVAGTQVQATVALQKIPESEGNP